MSNNFTTPSPQYLLHTPITPMIAKVPDLNAIATILEPADDYPVRTYQGKLITIGPVSQTVTASTVFTTGDSTFSNVPVAVSQISTSWQVENKGENLGARNLDLAAYALKAHELTLWKLVTAAFTAANFPTTPVVQPSSGFTLGDLPRLRRPIGAADNQALILHPDYYSTIASTAGFTQIAGWSSIQEASDFSTAAANVYGFAGNRASLLVVNGPPLDTGAPNIHRHEFTLPQLRIQSAGHVWFQPDTRTYWQSYDSIFGVGACDTTCGVLLKSA